MARIQLFRDVEFSGTPLIKNASDANLTNDGFNDVISSVVVDSGTFTLYEHANFEGYSFTVCKTGGPDSDGRYPHPLTLAGRENKISSIRKNSDQPL